MTDTQDTAMVLALVEAQAAAKDRLAQRLNLIISRLLRGFDGWYDDDQVAALSRRIFTAVRSSQKVQGGMTGQFMQAVLQILNADERRPSPIVLPESLRGLDDPTVPYDRIAAEYRISRAKELDDEQARLLAERRARLLAEDDLFLASREGARQRLVPADKVIGFRRIIHPELSRTGTCGLCLVASDRLYFKTDLLPMHTGCKCEVLPVTATSDPGSSINGEDLRRIYEAAGGNQAAALRKVRVQVVQHGELGPLLTDARHHFRDESEVRRTRLRRKRTAA